jgi:hypothetical protein
LRALLDAYPAAAEEKHPEVRMGARLPQNQPADVKMLHNWDKWGID